MTTNQICLLHLFEDGDPRVLKRELNVVQYPTGKIIAIFLIVTFCIKAFLHAQTI